MHTKRGVGLATTALAAIVAVLATALFFVYPGSNILPNNEKTGSTNEPITDLDIGEKEQAPSNKLTPEMAEECSSLSIPEDECTVQNIQAKNPAKYGTYSQDSQVQIRSVTLDETGAGTLNIVNKGASSETVSSVSGTFASGPTTYILVAADNPVIDANSENTAITFDLADAANLPAPMAAADLLAGQTATITIQTSSGQQYTVSTVATAH